MALRRSALKVATAALLLAVPALAALEDLNYLSSDTDVFTYTPSGSWSSSGGLMYSNSTQAVISFRIDASVSSFTFNGATKYDRGYFDVYVDDVKLGTCDAYSPAGAAVTTGAICTTTLSSTGSEHLVQFVNYISDARVGYAPYLTLSSVDVYALPPPVSSSTIPTLSSSTAPVYVTPTSTTPTTTSTPTSTTTSTHSTTIVVQQSSAGSASGANTIQSSAHSVVTSSASSTALFSDSTLPSTPTPTPAAKHSNVAAIAGGVAGGAVILLAALLGMCCMRRRQKAAEEEQFLGGSAYRDSAHTEYTDSPPMQQTPYQTPYQPPQQQGPNRFSTFSGHAEFTPTEEYATYETK